MSDYKFLSDGRKVALVGKLNNEEWIVQEVFVTQSGDEIPSGERFTAKSLHDAPVESFRDKELRRKELRLKELESDYEKVQRNLSQAKVDAQVASDIRKSLNAMAGNVGGEGMETLRQFLCGEIRWLVRETGYSFELPVPFEHAIKQVDSWGGRRRYEGIKLISLFGKANGDFAFRMGAYSDGSGSSYEVKPFDTFENAARYVIGTAVDCIQEERFSIKDCQALLESDCAQFLRNSEREILIGSIHKSIAAKEASKEEQVAKTRERCEDEIKTLKASLERYGARS